MVNEVRWRVQVKTEQQAHARRVLRRIVSAIGQPVEQRSLERYWKIPGNFVLDFTTPVEAGSVPEAVFQTMVLARAVGSGWLVSGPDNNHGDWTFQMLCAANASGRFHIAGVEQAHLMLATRTGA